MNRHWKLSAWTIAAAVALLVAGCSRLPTDPGATQAGAESPASPFAGGTSGSGDESGPQAGTDVGASSSDGGKVSAVQTKWVSRLLGGVVQAGRFKVVVPPLALRQNAVITVNQPDLRVNEVQLEISPPSANGFLVPVLLVADCSDMSKELLSLEVIWWWNPTTNRWELVLSSKVDLLARTVTAALNHFSTYKVDTKAGW